ncbi:MAG: hypothetical protein WDN69_28450 [Aliidongia sp.]
MRAEGLKIRLLLQVDTLCHRTLGFIEKCAKAGCYTVFIGLENINPQSLMETKKRQNKIWEYREMLQAWKHANVMTWAGYILGFPSDTPASIARDIAIIQRELPIDILEFFFLTPLPGSEDHKMLLMRGVEMDADLNKYDLEHYTTAHAKMSREEWEGIYRDCWSLYYTDAHVETILRRAVATGLKARRVADALIAFSGALRIEGVHPAATRLVPAQDPNPAAALVPAREPAAVLSALVVRRLGGGKSMGDPVLALSPDPGAGGARAGRQELYGCRAPADDNGRGRPPRRGLCRHHSPDLWRTATGSQAERLKQKPPGPIRSRRLLVLGHQPLPPAGLARPVGIDGVSFLCRFRIGRRGFGSGFRFRLSLGRDGNRLRLLGLGRQRCWGRRRSLDDRFDRCLRHGRLGLGDGNRRRSSFACPSALRRCRLGRNRFSRDRFDDGCRFGRNFSSSLGFDRSGLLARDAAALRLGLRDVLRRRFRSGGRLGARYLDRCGFSRDKPRPERPE